MTVFSLLLRLDMKKQKFEIGETVVMAGENSRRMVVVETDKIYVTCAWVDEIGKMQYRKFKYTELVEDKFYNPSNLLHI
jgi:hypothetical protein